MDTRPPQRKRAQAVAKRQPKNAPLPPERNSGGVSDARSAVPALRMSQAAGTATSRGGRVGDTRPPPQKVVRVVTGPTSKTLEHTFSGAGISTEAVEAGG